MGFHRPKSAILVYGPRPSGNVRVIERGEQLRFPLEARNPLWIASKDLRENLHCDAASKLRVSRLIHLSHSAGAELRVDVVMKKVFPDHCFGADFI
jgi:hypothetical protein